MQNLTAPSYLPSGEGGCPFHQHQDVAEGNQQDFMPGEGLIIGAPLQKVYQNPRRSTE